MALTKRMETRFRHLGGKVFTRHEARQVSIEGSRLRSVTFADGTTAYLLRCDWLVLALAVVGCTSLPRRLWEKRERAMTPALSDGLRTVWVAVVLLVSIAFLVGDSYNPFLYFRF